MHQVFILEGPDSAGKTTLARAIQKEVETRGEKFCYIHLTLRKEMALWQFAALTRAREKRKTHTVVIDRHWISEQVYGAVYRDQVITDRFAWPILAMACSMGAINVMCVPEVDTAKMFFSQTESREMYQNDDRVFRVAQAYRDVTFGNAYPDLVCGSLGWMIARRPGGLTSLTRWLHLAIYQRKLTDTLLTADQFAFEILERAIISNHPKHLSAALFGAH